MVKEIKNLEKYYEVKVLTGDNTFDPKLFRAKYGTRKLPWGPKSTMMHPVGPDGSRLDGESDSSDGSYLYKDDRPDTPLTDIPKSEAKEDMKIRLYHLICPGMIRNPDGVHQLQCEGTTITPLQS